MSHLIVVTHRLDLPAAAALLSQHEDAELRVFDPQLLDHARGLGLSRISLPRRPVPSFLNELFRSSRRMMSRFQTELESLLAMHVPEARGCQWGYFNTFYALLNLSAYRQLGQLLALEAADGQLVHLPGAAAAYRYGRPSFCPSMALASSLQAAGQEYRIYSYDPGGLPETQLPDWQGLDKMPAGAMWVHLPTCFYDAPHFADQLRKAGRPCVHIPSQYYAVELPGHEGLPLSPIGAVRQSLGAAHEAECQALTAKVLPHITSLLAPLMPGGQFLAWQAKAMADSLLEQLTLFRDLEQRARQLPSQLLISNHDAGLHGALLSHAQRHRLSVIMVPHSKFQNIPLARLPGQILCLHHPLQSARCQDLHGQQVVGHPLAFSQRLSALEEPRASRPLRKLGVLLNGVSHNGLNTADIQSYLDGLRHLMDWGRQRGVDVLLRYKPTEGFPLLLQEALGLSAETLQGSVGQSLQDFVLGCDACVGYDIPTSAAIEPLLLAVPTLHCQLRSLVWEEKALLNTDVVPSLLLEECLDELDAWWRDPALRWDFLRQQHARVAQRLAQAPSLAQYLS